MVISSSIGLKTLRGKRKKCWQTIRQTIYRCGGGHKNLKVPVFVAVQNRKRQELLHFLSVVPCNRQGQQFA